MTTITSRLPIISPPSGNNRFQLLERKVHEQLRQSGRSQLQSVVCFCDDDQCILTGRLPTFFLKQVAQAIVIRVDGVGKIDNRIEVIDANAVTGHKDG
jgi:osmotically-inducible protein OsmY